MNELAAGFALSVGYNIAALIGGLDPLLLIANNFFLVSALIAGGSITYLLECLFRDQFLAEKALVREREALAWQSQNDARYLSWLRQLAQFLRHEVRNPVAQINSSIELAQLTCKDDKRVAPWMTAKMAARMQTATTSGRPVLVRIESDAGHGVGSTRDQALSERADVFAFLLTAAGDAALSPPK